MEETKESLLTAAEWITLAAILMGPVLAVLVTRIVDYRRERRNRRMDVFRTLMRTRRTNLDQDHVGALNLVEIEFYGKKEVINNLRELFRHFGAQHARAEHERTDVQGISNIEMNRRDDNYYQRLGRERNTLLSRLLHSIAKSLGLQIEQLEIFEGGYTPVGWAHLEDDQAIVRRWAVDLATGRRAVPVAVFDYINPTRDTTPNSELDEKQGS